MPPHMGINDDYQTLAVSLNKSNQYQIRSMDETDIDTVVEIERITWRNESWSSQDFFRALNDPFWNCWILESTTSDHLVLGYGLQYLSNNASHIANLCIHPNRRGRGIGGILLRHMINFARQIGASIVELEVNTSNIHAYRLYVKHGFTIVQFLERYYSDTADAYRMQLIINSIDYRNPKPSYVTSWYS